MAQWLTNLTSIHEDAARRPSQTAPRIPTHRKSETINICCFKLLSFGVICHVAIDNNYTSLAPCHSTPLPGIFLFLFLQHQLLRVHPSSSLPVLDPETCPMQMFSHRRRNEGTMP